MVAWKREQRRGSEKNIHGKRAIDVFEIETDKVMSAFDLRFSFREGGQIFEEEGVHETMAPGGIGFSMKNVKKRVVMASISDEGEIFKKPSNISAFIGYEGDSGVRKALLEDGYELGVVNTNKPVKIGTKEKDGITLPHLIEDGEVSYMKTNNNGAFGTGVNRD